MSTTINPPPVTESQRALLARLVGQGRVTIQQLEDAGVGRMSRPELAAWVEANVIGSPADEQTRRAVDQLFDWHSKAASYREPAA
jgi:hypothetical protein